MTRDETPASDEHPRESRSSAREMRRITAAIIVSALGTWSYNVAIAVYAYQATGSTAWVAAATVGRYVPALFIASIGSRWASRFPRRAVAITSDIVCAAVMLLLTIVASSGGSLVLAIALSAISSGLARVQSAAALALASDVVLESELVRRMAFISTSEAVATAVGPALASAVLLIASPAWLFLLNSVSFLLSAALLLGVRDRRRRVGQVRSTSTSSPGGRATVLTTVRPLLAVRALAAIVYGADIVLLAVIATDTLRSGTSGYGWMLAAAGAGGLVVAVVLRQRDSDGGIARPVVLGMALYAVPLLAYLIIGGLLPALLVQAVRGLGAVLLVTLLLTALQRGVPSDLSQEVFGRTHSLVLVGTVVGSVVTPLLISSLGLDATLWILALLPLLASLAVLPGLRRYDGTSDLAAAMLDPVVHTLRGLTLFQDASRWTLVEVADRVEPIGVQPGQVVVREGDEADALYVLVEGSVEVTTDHEDGPRVLRQMHAPAYFGEIGLIQRVPRTATVTAIGAATLWRIPGDAFLDAASQAGVSGALSDSVRVRLRNTPGRAASVEV
ncbi:MAG: MFS transporter [Candidatus Nanopelagicales bacterium]